MKLYIGIFLFHLCACVSFSQVEIDIKDTTYRLKEEILVQDYYEMRASNRVELIDKGYIQKLNGSRLSDALDAADGVFVKDYGFNSGLKLPSLNATESEQTAIFYNGVNLNSKENSLFDLGLLQTDDIDKMTVSDGGSSALYGNEAIGGVVNIFSNDYLDTGSSNRILNMNLNSELGSYGMKKIYLRLMHHNFNKFSFLVSYSHEDSKNDYQYDFFDGTNEVLKNRQNSDYHNENLNIESNVKLGSKSQLHFFTIYSYWNRGVPGQELGYEPSSSRQIDRNLISSVSLDHTLNSKFTLNTNFNYQYSLMNYFDTTTFSLPMPLNSFYKLATYSGTGSLEYNDKSGTRLHLGYESSYSQFNSDQAEEGKLFEGSINFNAEQEIKNSFFHSIILYPSVRYDYYSNIGEKSVLTGKLGINIMPFKNIAFTLKSSFGNNFCAPTFNELYWIGVGNKDLSPERSTSFDAGAFYEFRFLTQNSFEVSYFNIDTRDRIVWEPQSSGIWRPVNIGEVRSEGIQLSLKSSKRLFGRIDLSFSADFNYGTAIKESEDYPGDPTYGKQLIYIPQEFSKGSLGIGYLTSSKVIKFVSLHVFYSYAGRRYSDLENTSFTPHYGIFDGNFSVGLNVFKSEVNLKFAVNNIFNENYQVVQGYPMPLRNYRIELGIKY